MRPFVIPVCLACLLGLSCFSTIAPDRDDGSGGSGGLTPGGAASIHGKVLLFRAAGQWEGLTTSVRVVWYASDGRELFIETVLSNADGLYRAQRTHKDIARVEVAAHKCDYDPIYPAPRFICCIEDPYCHCESIWDTAYSNNVGPGATAVRDIRLYCDPTPDATH